MITNNITHIPEITNIPEITCLKDILNSLPEDTDFEHFYREPVDESSIEVLTLENLDLYPEEEDPFYDNVLIQVTGAVKHKCPPETPISVHKLNDYQIQITGIAENKSQCTATITQTEFTITITLIFFYLL